jgi:hypothetical protein
MNLNDPRHPWTRLTSAARQVPDSRDTEAPYGFATRVAALACAQEARLVFLFDRFALRALAVSCLLALGSVAVNYSAVRNVRAPAQAQVVDEEAVPVDDALAAVLDFAD